MSTKFRPIIAVDIDDVLAANAEGFVEYSNRKWGTHLSLEDYDEHWERLWDVDIQELARRSDQFHIVDRAFRDYRHKAEAKPVLEHLAQSYTLMIVTSRRREGQQDTIEWIDKYFQGIFSEMHFAGFWDKVTDKSILGTKAKLCKQIGADYLIDDQLKHCIAAAQEGIEAILFGDYTWNQRPELPPHVTRCADWTAIERYFNNIHN